MTDKEKIKGMKRVINDLNLRIEFLLNHFECKYFTFPDGETFYPSKRKEQ